MGSHLTYAYEPDFVTAPGEMLEEKLQEIGMSQAELAERIGRTRKTVNELIKGKAPLVPETAVQLERVLGVPARFWASAEANYHQALAGHEEALRLATQEEWLRRLPVRALVKRGILSRESSRVSRLRELLNFFGVASFEALLRIGEERYLAFRQSPAHEVNRFALLAWLRLGKLQAQKVACAPYNEGRFRQTLREIRNLCIESPPVAAPNMQKGCAESGVALVFVPEIPGARAWGVTQWVSADKAILQLSLRGKSDDQFWFTFFHEAAHILLHPKRAVYVEFGQDADEHEEEANRFARDILIPPADWRRIAATPPRSAAQVRAWAKKLGIAPGVLVGRLQHERILPWTHLNGLKVKLRFKEHV
ncbi:MAG: HigA family addiction module antidote protein [Dehalococcoidia bacterium]|nr:HigA family addiction module antidote protein [Dehalococcoidia bacterium]